MFERIGNGWELVKASGRALAADRELLVFPLVSGIATLLVMATFVVPVVASGLWQGVTDTTASKAFGLAVTWLFYFCLQSVAIFFNTALVGAALKRLDGGNPTLGDGLAVASKRLPAILGFAAISATVGLIVKFAQRRGGMVQRWVMSLVGLAWSLATFLVIPVLAARGVGPLDAIRESASLFKRTWGEQVVGAGGIRIVSGLVTLLLLLLFVPLIAWAAAAGYLEAAIAAGVALGLLMIVLMAVTSALQGIYTAALYRFATGGKAGFGFAAERLSAAFVRR